MRLVVDNKIDIPDQPFSVEFNADTKSPLPTGLRPRHKISRTFASTAELSDTLVNIGGDHEIHLIGSKKNGYFLASPPKRDTGPYNNTGYTLRFVLPGAGQSDLPYDC